MEDDRASGADSRVNVKSKKMVRDQLEKYKDLFKKLFDGQCHISQEDKAKLLQEMVVVSLVVTKKICQLDYCCPYQVYHVFVLFFVFTIVTPSVFVVIMSYLRH